MSGVQFDQTHDVVVIGAGHNGLCVANLLLDKGLDVLVLERQGSPGGLARTDQGLLAGFSHHSHANFLSYLDLHAPGAVDFAQMGVETIWPERQHGICFADGRPPIILGRPDHAELTRRSIARHSEKDARTYTRVKFRADKLSGVLGKAFFSSPNRPILERQGREIRAAFSEFRLSNALGTGSAKTVIDDLFESPALRTLLYRLALELGGSLEDSGSDAAFLGYVLWVLGRRRIPVGGMSAVPDALTRSILRKEGQVRCGVEVVAIQLDAGRAASVITSHGSTIGARHGIVSSVPVSDLYSKLAADLPVSKTTRFSVAALDGANTTAVSSTKYCLQEAPRYASATIDPGINECLMTFIGLDEPELVADASRSVRHGAFPPPTGAIRVNTLWDSSQAPEGFHAAGVDTMFPSTKTINAGAMRELAIGFPAALLEEWAQYAPNMTEENVVAQEFTLSRLSERSLYFVEGDDQYRSDLPGLYMCGSETYPGGGVHGACAFNASRVILADLGAN